MRIDSDPSPVLRSWLTFVLGAVLLAGCGGDPPTPEEAFENLTLPVISLGGTEVTLESRQARIEGDGVTLLLDDLHLIGDLRRDGTRIMTGVLFVTRPGTPTVAELVVAEAGEDGRLEYRASHRLGEGLRVEGIRYAEGEIVLHLRSPEADDPPCCPSRAVQERFRYEHSVLVPVEAETEA